MTEQLEDQTTAESRDRVRWVITGYRMAVEEGARYRGAWLSARRRARSHNLLVSELELRIRRLERAAREGAS